MWCTQNFAFIVDGEVKDIVVCNDYNVANQIAQNIYGSGAIATDVTHYTVDIGDTYTNNKFFRGEREIHPLPTVEDKLNGLGGSVADLETAACDLDETIYQRILDIEDALCEISEMLSE